MSVECFRKVNSEKGFCLENINLNQSALLQRVMTVITATDNCICLCNRDVNESQKLFSN